MIRLPWSLAMISTLPFLNTPTLHVEEEEEERRRRGGGEEHTIATDTGRHVLRPVSC